VEDVAIRAPDAVIATKVCAVTPAENLQEMAVCETHKDAIADDLANRPPDLEMLSTPMLMPTTVTETDPVRGTLVATTEELSLASNVNDALWVPYCNSTVTRLSAWRNTPAFVFSVIADWECHTCAALLDAPMDAPREAAICPNRDPTSVIEISPVFGAFVEMWDEIIGLSMLYMEVADTGQTMLVKATIWFQPIPITDFVVKDVDATHLVVVKDVLPLRTAHDISQWAAFRATIVTLALAVAAELDSWCITTTSQVKDAVTELSKASIEAMQVLPRTEPRGDLNTTDVSDCQTVKAALEPPDRWSGDMLTRPPLLRPNTVTLIAPVAAVLLLGASATGSPRSVLNAVVAENLDPPMVNTTDCFCS
jgi:hypothetical protein